jgi:plastocyanin
MTLFPRLRRLALTTAIAATAASALLAGSALAAGHSVSIVARVYEPNEITIAVGDTVTWTVEESVGEPHSVTSGKANEQNAGSLFDSGTEGLTDVGETYEFTFDQAGVVDYFCTVHGAAMSGQVTVLAPGQTPPAAEPPPSEGEHDPIPPERKALAGGILAVSIVLMFGMAWVWRRMNPA